MNKISIIIPVYNALDDLKLCIESIVCNVNFEYTSVLIIDDCSSSETKNYLKNLAHPKIKIIFNEQNLGFIKTCNKGLLDESAEIYVLLNSDTIIPKNFCEKIIECFESDENIGIASPISSHSSRYYILKPLNMSLDEINSKIEKIHNPKYPEIPSSEGFCFCIKKDTIDKIGVLDTIYGKGYHEEIDYSYRAIQNGIKCSLIDNLYVYHKNNVSFGSVLRRKQMEENSKIFKKRWGNFYKNWIKEHKHINPIKKLRKEFFKDRFITRCEKAYIMNIFGRLFKIKL